MLNGTHCWAARTEDAIAYIQSLELSAQLRECWWQRVAAAITPDDRGEISRRDHRSKGDNLLVFHVKVSLLVTGSCSVSSLALEKLCQTWENCLGSIFRIIPAWVWRQHSHKQPVLSWGNGVCRNNSNLHPRLSLPDHTTLSPVFLRHTLISRLQH